MKHQTSKLRRFEEISLRYDGPIPKSEYAKLDAHPNQNPSLIKAAADLRFWKNYIKSGITAYRSVATPKRREQIAKDIRAAWPKYRSAFQKKASECARTKASVCSFF